MHVSHLYKDNLYSNTRLFLEKNYFLLICSFLLNYAQNFIFKNLQLFHTRFPVSRTSWLHANSYD